MHHWDVIKPIWGVPEILWSSIVGRCVPCYVLCLAKTVTSPFSTCFNTASSKRKLYICRHRWPATRSTKFHQPSVCTSTAHHWWSGAEPWPSTTIHWAATTRPWRNPCPAEQQCPFEWCETHYAPIRPSSWPETLERQINKASKSALVACLAYLGRSDMNEFTKDACVTAMICRIQNLLPDQCNLGREQYCINVTDTPLLPCAVCGQGTHDQKCPCVLSGISRKIRHEWIHQGRMRDRHDL